MSIGDKNNKISEKFK